MTMITIHGLDRETSERLYARQDAITSNTLADRCDDDDDLSPRRSRGQR